MDVEDFAIGMGYAVREDPDVMLVGEMRDRGDVPTAIQAAETGHLVFGTIHASSAPPRSAASSTCSPTPCTPPSAALAFNLQRHRGPEAAPLAQAGRRPGARRSKSCSSTPPSGS